MKVRLGNGCQRGNCDCGQFDGIEYQYEGQLPPFHGGCDCVVLDATAEEKALELWREFFERDNDPFVVQTYWGEDLQCYFCDGKPDHKPDCIYIRAKALIEGE